MINIILLSCITDVILGPHPRLVPLKAIKPSGYIFAEHSMAILLL